MRDVRKNHGEHGFAFGRGSHHITRVGYLSFHVGGIESSGIDYNRRDFFMIISQEPSIPMRARISFSSVREAIFEIDNQRTTLGYPKGE